MKKLYCNATIHTMAKPATVQAVLTQDGKILSAGELTELRKEASDAKIIDLKGKTMLPAFIDAHSHLSSFASSFLQLSLEECTDYNEIAQRIRDFILQNKVESGAWVIAKGYDHNALTQKCHPTLELLDFCAPKNPRCAPAFLRSRRRLLPCLI